MFSILTVDSRIGNSSHAIGNTNRSMSLIKVWLRYLQKSFTNSVTTSSHCSVWINGAALPNSLCGALVRNKTRNLNFLISYSYPCTYDASYLSHLPGSMAENFWETPNFKDLFLLDTNGTTNNDVLFIFFVLVHLLCFEILFIDFFLSFLFKPQKHLQENPKPVLMGLTVNSFIWNLGRQLFEIKILDILGFHT